MVRRGKRTRGEEEAKPKFRPLKKPCLRREERVIIPLEAVLPKDIVNLIFDLVVSERNLSAVLPACHTCRGFYRLIHDAVHRKTDWLASRALDLVMGLLVLTAGNSGSPSDLRSIFSGPDGAAFQISYLGTSGNSHFCLSLPAAEYAHSLPSPTQPEVGRRDYYARFKHMPPAAMKKTCTPLIKFYLKMVSPHGGLHYKGIYSYPMILGTLADMSRSSETLWASFFRLKHDDGGLIPFLDLQAFAAALCGPQRANLENALSLLSSCITARK